MPLAEINSEQSGESSQEEYEPDPTKSPLNKSISNLSNEWTPVKSLLQSDFDTLKKSRRYDVLRKSKKAVDLVLEGLAPNQGNRIFEELAKNHQFSEAESSTIRALQEAVKTANGEFLVSNEPI